jgi:hypothetical protein
MAVHMFAAEFISLFIIKLKTTGSISMKIRQANLMLVMLSAVFIWCCRTVSKHLVVMNYEEAATVTLPLFYTDVKFLP